VLLLPVARGGTDAGASDVVAASGGTKAGTGSWMQAGIERRQQQCNRDQRQYGR
jgi:hypothetical protein